MSHDDSTKMYVEDLFKQDLRKRFSVSLYVKFNAIFVVLMDDSRWVSYAVHFLRSLILRCIWWSFRFQHCSLVAMASRPEGISYAQVWIYAGAISFSTG